MSFPDRLWIPGSSQKRLHETTLLKESGLLPAFGRTGQTNSLNDEPSIHG